MSTDRDGSLLLQKDIQNDVDTLGKQAGLLIQTVFPYLTVDQKSLCQYLDSDSVQTVESMHFFRLSSCTIEQMDELATYLNEKIDKLLTAMHSLDVSVAYGIVSYEGQTNIILGVDSKDSKDIIELFLKGLLTGIEISPYDPAFSSRKTVAREGGILSAVPIVKIEDERQKFDISTLIRSLNGQNYTVLCVARPYPMKNVQQRYGEIVSIKDKCFAVSKRNLARQKSESNTDTTTNTQTNTTTWGGMAGLMCGPIMIGGNGGNSISESVSSAVAKTIGTSDTISYDVQNGLALELMDYCDKAIERLRQGLNTGMWGTAIAYSADNPVTAKVIRACLSGELAKPTNNILPLQEFHYELNDKECILIPKLQEDNPLLVPVTSPELGMLCTPPYEAVPDFEVRYGKLYPMIASQSKGAVIGKVTDGYKSFENMNFVLSEEDLNKHTFVCGITGSGKTTAVKGILTSCNKPFMILESAKKEYRNINIKNQSLTVYTLGKPELNCLQFNPFYIQRGINLQTHIDFLKDLFNASFSFYGPMPYILEKCLYNIYKNKGWNLTLGYHPYLLNMKNVINIFDSNHLKIQYSYDAHKYLFPTMHDLKDEVKRYIDIELQYDGEVGGNIKTAMLSRLDSLCVGSKGFMLNTQEPIAIDQLMQTNVVFELEGLADDSDKAFCVGLLVIFVNEYRQVYKDEHPTDQLSLRHLLVIEEAHRLLKNVDTEKTSENMGNPKGKAVEHFTNMIAEMRSYGQGVIIAEQIPSKLAPDVIKNSSNKIIHRVVSADDQFLIANTIGIKEEDAVYLGNLKTGFALCHKEGMNLPVCVKVRQERDNIVLDENIFTKREGKMFDEINLSLVRENTADLINSISLKLLNSILAQSPKLVIKTIHLCKQTLMNELTRRGVTLAFCSNKEEPLGIVLTDGVMQFLVNGVYSFNGLVNNELYTKITNLFIKENIKDIDDIRYILEHEHGYMQNSRNRCIVVISELIRKQYDKSVNLKKSIQQYFMVEEEDLFSEIEAMIRKNTTSSHK